MTTNALPLRDISKSATGCCPPFDPADWDGRTFTFDRKLFLKFTTRSLFHIPLNMGSMMMNMMARIDNAGADSPEYFMLSDEVSPWKAEHYMAVTKTVPDAEMVHLSGTYVAKVFDGSYRNLPKWYKEVLRYVVAKGKTPTKIYFNYTMCPQCAKAYGHNYVVGFAQVG